MIEGDIEAARRRIADVIERAAERALAEIALTVALARQRVHRAAHFHARSEGQKRRYERKKQCP